MPAHRRADQQPLARQVPRRQPRSRQRHHEEQGGGNTTLFGIVVMYKLISFRQASMYILTRRGRQHGLCGRCHAIAHFVKILCAFLSGQIASLNLFSPVFHE